MGINNTMSQNKEDKKSIAPRTENVYALPLLKPTYQYLINQEITFDPEVSEIFGLDIKPIKISIMNNDKVAEILLFCIEKGILKNNEVENYLELFNCNEKFENSFQLLEDKVLEFSSHKIINCSSNIKTKLNNQGFEFSPETIGNISFTEESFTQFIFRFDEVLKFWEINLVDISEELRNIIVGASRLFCNLASISTVQHIITEDEIYTSIESLPISKIKSLQNIFKTQDKKNLFNKLHSTMGSKVFNEITETLESYYEWYVECEETSEEIINCIKRCVDSVLFDQHDFFHESLNFDMNNTRNITRKINKFIKFSDSEKDVEFVKKIKELIGISKSEYQKEHYEFECLGDLESLSAQQFIIFNDVELMEISIDRLEDIGNYLLETGEEVSLLIDTENDECIKAFKNIQNGWLMISALIKLTENNYDRNI